jgi:hypothetical protein
MSISPYVTGTRESQKNTGNMFPVCQNQKHTGMGTRGALHGEVSIPRVFYD